ncbi:hypothetical protein L208DRAFT_1413628 [Tricholoma matsutake]|nr:hypothetical protein L208DRAFT_1413628 [Tricholoma matsutake 945]
MMPPAVSDLPNVRIYAPNAIGLHVHYNVNSNNTTNKTTTGSRNDSSISHSYSGLDVAGADVRHGLLPDIRENLTGLPGETKDEPHSSLSSSQDNVNPPAEENTDNTPPSSSQYSKHFRESAGGGDGHNPSSRTSVTLEQGGDRHEQSQRGNRICEERPHTHPFPICGGVLEFTSKAVINRFRVFLFLAVAICVFKYYCDPGSCLGVSSSPFASVC